MKKILLFSIVFIIAAFIPFGASLPFHSFETDVVSAATAPAPTPTPTPKPTPTPTPAPTPAPVPQTPTTPIPSEQPVVWSSNPSNWANQDIQKAKSYGLTISSLMAQYNRPITREQFVQLVMKQFYANGGSADGSTVTKPFIDTSDSVIAEAFNAGIISGTGNGKFNPSGLLTRQEAAVILYREWSVLNATNNESIVFPRAFSDSEKISVWATDAIRFMNQVGVLKGTNDGKINPTGNTTREQAMILVLRSYEAITALNIEEIPDAVSSATVNQNQDADDDEDDD